MASNVDNLTIMVNAQTKAAQKSIKELQMEMLGFGLSVLFGGMAIKMLGQTILRSLSNTFMTIADAQHAAVQEMNALNAAFTFLKFSIFETLAQTELFQSFVNFLIQAASSIAQFVQKNPEVAALLGLFSVIAIVLGTIGMVLGQLALLFTGLGTAMYPILFGIVAIPLLAYSAFDTLNKETDNFIALLKLVGALFLSMISLAVVFGVTITLPFLLLAGVIAVVGAAFLLMTRHLGSAKLAAMAFGVFLLRVFAFIGDAILQAIIQPLNLVIAAFNRVMAALGNSQRISLIEATPLGSRVDAMRDKILEEAQVAKANRPYEDPSASSSSLSDLTESIRLGMEAALDNKELIPRSTDA